MKEITIKGISLSYEVDVRSESPDYTYFYYGTRKVKKRKYGFFGPVFFVEEPRILFSIDGNIEEPERSKKWWKKKIKKNLWRVQRYHEILSGDIL